ncbi:hypothetical protein NC652_015147 [Populus alba x Populus x berolinensis]|nr:hypothetical protein NC652_015147 [Populus alba x Populus x berolinensis]
MGLELHGTTQPWFPLASQLSEAEELYNVNRGFSGKGNVGLMYRSLADAKNVPCCARLKIVACRVKDTGYKRSEGKSGET